MEHMEEVYEIQQHAFRLNLHFGLILVNTETGEYRYFVPHENEALFPRPIYISRRHDLTKLRNRLDRFNVVDPRGDAGGLSREYVLRIPSVS